MRVTRHSLRGFSLGIPRNITQLSHQPLNMWKSMPIGMIGFRPSKAQWHDTLRSMRGWPTLLETGVATLALKQQPRNTRCYPVLTLFWPCPDPVLTLSWPCPGPFLAVSWEMTQGRIPEQFWAQNPERKTSERFPFCPWKPFRIAKGKPLKTVYKRKQ